jgi:uncharacterized protein YacL
MTTANAGTGSNNQEGDKSWQEPKAALTTVLAGVGGIVLLGIAALLILGLKLESSEATVSVATAAFGVVGSIVGAYFGVKIGSEQAAAATNQNADLTKRVQAAETKADAYASTWAMPTRPRKRLRTCWRQSKAPLLKSTHTV